MLFRRAFNSPFPACLWYLHTLFPFSSWEIKKRNILMENVTIASLQQALQVQQRNKNTSGDSEVVFQHWLNQHFNIPILIVVSIFNFLWKLFTFYKPFGWNIEVRFQLSLSLLETTSIFASLIPSQQILNFHPFQSNSGRKKKNRKSLQNTFFLWGSNMSRL